MDTALLSKMLGELILDHDQVGLPGLGTFVAELVPSSFSDRGYTINPPYRRLAFYQRESQDTLLADFYASSNGIDRNAAASILGSYLAELQASLQSSRTVVFPGLGRLRATRDNHYFFVCNEDLDIFPEGIGLEPVSLKTHMETEDELSSAVSSLANLIAPEPAKPQPESSVTPEEPVASVPDIPASEGPAPTEPQLESPATEPTKAEQRAEKKAAREQARIEASALAAANRTDNTPGRRHRRFKWWIIPIVAVVLAAIALGAFLILARTAPDFIDSLLYTPEELSIIDAFK